MGIYHTTSLFTHCHQAFEFFLEPGRVNSVATNIGVHIHMFVFIYILELVGQMSETGIARSNGYSFQIF